MMRRAALRSVGLQNERAPLRCTTGPLPPIFPWLVPFPVIPLNSPVPPVISQVPEMVNGKPVGLAEFGQIVPTSAIAIDPVAPTSVYSALKGLQGATVKSWTAWTVMVNGPMMLAAPAPWKTRSHTPASHDCETRLIWLP